MAARHCISFFNSTTNEDTRSGHIADGRARSRLCLSADVAKHVGVNVQTDIGQVVEMLARHKPDDFADFTLGIIAGERAKVSGLTSLFLVSSIA